MYCLNANMSLNKTEVFFLECELHILLYNTIGATKPNAAFELKLLTSHPTAPSCDSNPQSQHEKAFLFMWTICLFAAPVVVRRFYRSGRDRVPPMRRRSHPITNSHPGRKLTCQSPSCCWFGVRQLVSGSAVWLDGVCAVCAPEMQRASTGTLCCCPALTSPWKWTGQTFLSERSRSSR